MRIQRLAVLFLLVTFIFSTQPITLANNQIWQVNKEYSQNYWRTEIYFGRDKNDGTQVTDEEWSNFMDEIVTPKFPNGLTVLDANGQYRIQNGTIVKEKSKVLILLYAPKIRLLISRKIDQVRNEYKKKFRQEAVMRIDLLQSVKVSF